MVDQRYIIIIFLDIYFVFCEFDSWPTEMLFIGRVLFFCFFATILICELILSKYIKYYCCVIFHDMWPNLFDTNTLLFLVDVKHKHKRIHMIPYSIVYILTSEWQSRIKRLKSQSSSNWKEFLLFVLYVCAHVWALSRFVVSIISASFFFPHFLYMHRNKFMLIHCYNFRLAQ